MSIRRQTAPAKLWMVQNEEGKWFSKDEGWTNDSHDAMVWEHPAAAISRLAGTLGGSDTHRLVGYLWGSTRAFGDANAGAL